MAIHNAGLWTAFPGEAKPPPGAVVNPGHPLGANVIACWMFNEATGGQAADVGPYGFHANPLAAATQKFGSRYGINGLTTNAAATNSGWASRISSGAGLGNLTPPRFSVELRGYFESGFGSSASPFWWGEFNAFSGVQFRLVNSTQCNFVIGTGGTQTAQATGMDYTKPVHLLGTSGGSGSGEFRIYVNGKLAGSNASGFGVSWSSTPRVVFGRGGVGTSLVSCLDYCVIFNRALTAAEAYERYMRPYSIVALPRNVPRLAGATSPPPPATARGAALFPCCM